MTADHPNRRASDKEDYSDVNTQVAVMKNDVKYIKESVTRIEQLVKSEYVLKVEFEPIKRIVYGMVGLILTAVLMGLVALVVRK